MSRGSYICGDCDKVFEAHGEIIKHKKNEHDKAQAEKLLDNSLNNEVDDNELVVLVEEVESFAKSNEVEIIVKHTMDKLYDMVMNEKSNQTENCHECNKKGEKTS